MVFVRTFLLCLQLLVLTSGNAVFGSRHQRHSLLVDKAALLKFKNYVLDPNSTLAGWNESVHVCNFRGVTCNKHWHRVARLELPQCGLFGRLSPFISNLTGLRVLNLVDNHFFGTIPTELSHLRHLRHLKLDRNNLNGSVPESLSRLSNLTLILMNGNNLAGTLPLTFFSNCTELKVIDLANNFLYGRIPEEIGNCPNLWTLSLYNNKFTGLLPHSLTNTSMYNLDVENNLLSGELPSNIIEKLPSLTFLHLSYNGMTSHDHNTNLEPFFTALINCTSLEELELAGMGLGGRLPRSIGQLGINFSSLLLQENQIFGSIPSDIGNLSNLTLLNLTSNLLNGTIPSEIGRLISLEQLFLSHNLLSTNIPEAIGQLSHLGLIDLSDNQFQGKIPGSLGNLVQIKFIFLNNNFLSGTIPPTLGKCSDLYRLDLSYNRLTGRIPPELSGIREIRIFLNLSHNQLDGPLPIELSKLENVQEIDLSSNKLTGNIFPQISGCIAARSLKLSHNFIQGDLPNSLGDLKYLESFDISVNNLSGVIPESISNISTLTFLNLSFNDFHGTIPSGGIFNSVTSMSFLGNPHLCGTVPGMQSCPKRHQIHSHTVLFISVAIIVVSAIPTVICCVILIPRIKAMVSARKNEAIQKTTTPELMQNFPRITYRELSDATEGFDVQSLLGAGSYGRVFKGTLPDGTAIAVKVLNLQTGNSTKSFNRECQVLKRIRHRNLIRIITACSLPDFKALVLPYMANGNLDGHLYPHSGTSLGSRSSDLSLIQRVNICSDVAEGMAYLHHHSPVRVVHCDLKPSNVLLNDDMTALVSDFGISRLVIKNGTGNGGGYVESMGNSTADILSGSIGYIAPEYGYGSGTSIKGDVYSFGILVLEMVTRKRPTDDMFAEGLSLPRWVKNHYHGRVEKVVDSSLTRALRDQSTEVKKMWEVAIRELMELGILCTQESPSTRPTMLDVADDLDRLKRYLSGDSTVTFTSSLGISSTTLDDDL